MWPDYLDRVPEPANYHQPISLFISAPPISHV